MAKRPPKEDPLHLHGPTNPGSPTDGAYETAERHQRGELIHEQEERTGEETATIIPFPTDEAPADDRRPAPQSTHDTQGDAEHASAAQRLWVARARRRVAKKSRRKRDWDRFTFREKFTPLERLEREKANYRKEKLLSGKHSQLPDPAVTIIPLPSEQAQAADGSVDPSGDI